MTSTANIAADRDRAGRRVLHREPDQAARHRRIPRSARPHRSRVRVHRFPDARVHRGTLPPSSSADRIGKVQMIFSDPTTEPLEALDRKGAVGAFDREARRSAGAERVTRARGAGHEVHRPSRAHGVAHHRRLPADGADRLRRGDRAGVLGRVGSQHAPTASRTTSASSPTSSRGARRSTASSTTPGSG